MPKIILIILALILVAFLGYQNFYSNTVIDKDTVISGDYKISKGKTVVFKNGPKVIVEGKTEIEGTLSCENGPLNLEVKGKLTVDGVINCQRKDSEFKEKQAAVAGLAIVVSGGSADFNQDSIIASNGSIQIVDEPDSLLKTPEDLAKAFDEAGEDSGEGIRIGPFVDENQPQKVLGESFGLVKEAYAQTPPFYRFGSTVVVGRPDNPLPRKLDLADLSKYGDKVLVLFKLKKGKVEFPNGWMKGPEGLDGDSVKGGCAIDLSKIKPDQPGSAGKGYRMRVNAKAIIVNNYDLYLGRGGNGGNAETDKNCNPGVAIAGNGGESANMKWTADEYIEIKGRLTIHPGKAGDGGNAIAYGKDGAAGCPGENGGNGAAKGGNGADNIKNLRATGDIRGLDKIYIDNLIAGNGGKAEAHPGKGGDGISADKCCKGGIGGKGVENFGKGGIAQMKLPKGVSRVEANADQSGKDGGEDRVFTAEPGKDSALCSEKKAPAPSPAQKLQDQTGKSSYDAASEGVPIEVLVIDGQNYPAKQFRVAAPDVCGAPHYHSDYEVSTVDLKNHKVDPNPTGCGFGKVSEVPKKTISITKEQASAWQ